jgi:O-antigen/teichoic acid export membrane protein
MGVVKRQGIKQSVVTYSGMMVGAVNLLVLYPAAFSEEQIGIINFVRDTAVVLTPFLFWGGAELIVRYFPAFRNKSRGHNGYLFLLHIIFAIGVITLLSLYFLFNERLMAFYGLKSELYREFLPFVMPTALLFTHAAIFSSYASNFQRIVVPNVFNELAPKVGLSLLSLAYLLHFLVFRDVFWGQIIIYGLILLAQMWYVRHLGEFYFKPDLKFPTKPLIKDMTSFGLYGLIGNLGSRVGERINTIMLGTISSLGNTGIYSVAFFISDSIDAPRRAISRISSPLLADKWAAGKMDEIEEIYQKSSLNQLIVGLGLLLAVWVSVDELFQIMPNGENFAAGKYVILILGFARVIDMMTGLNSEIISYSGYFRVNFYLIVLLAVFSIAANLVLIPKFQINGAALSTLFSLSIFNIIKFMFLKWKWNLQPFTRSTLWVLLAGSLAYLITMAIPAIGHPVISMGVKSTFSLILFGAIILYFNLSPDVSQLVRTGLEKLGRFRKK